ncbi:MAG: ribonuclease H-like domain-containing protein [Bacteroidia bacterium]
MNYTNNKSASILDTTDINCVLFIDIETVPMVKSYEELPDSFKELWLTKAKRYSNEGSTPEEAFFLKAGLHPEFAKVVCISVGYFKYSETTQKANRKVTSYFGHDEAEILANFKELLEKYYNDCYKHFLCAHNGLEFDYPFLAKRMMINGIRLPKLLNVAGKKPWESKWLLDTMELWKFGSFTDKGSLALLAACFNIKSPKDDISGADVAYVYYFEDALERIRIYCEKDVTTLISLFTKMANVTPAEDFQEALERSDIEL